MFLLMMATLAVALAADLLLDLASQDMVINDLISSIASVTPSSSTLIQLVLCGCYLLVQPGHLAATHLLPCLDHQDGGTTGASSIKATILQEEGG